ncbi:hypothetical protein VTK73DRAFT_3755 [Phialemonium thermophilum]|uniref:Uncharacterized protein n=1 Tax=Phialemonium thermophilum TaxID=223376 RepID=A0ABR3VFG0_9PEZI
MLPTTERISIIYMHRSLLNALKRVSVVTPLRARKPQNPGSGKHRQLDEGRSTLRPGRTEQSDRHLGKDDKGRIRTDISHDGLGLGFVPPPLAQLHHDPLVDTPLHRVHEKGAHAADGQAAEEHAVTAAGRHGLAVHLPGAHASRWPSSGRGGVWREKRGGGGAAAAAGCGGGGGTSKGRE